MRKPTTGSAPGYRPDIDGLRAVAVASVVGFHFFPETVRGGFVGVDVFFVISGYLITALLAGELRSGGIAFLDFYARRVRRIFPALALTLAFTLAAGAVVLPPEGFRALGLEVAAGAASGANLLFWRQAGYFDAAAASKPLLHLWSLAVEEQFYLLWPLALALAARARWPLAAFAGAVGLVSFALNLVLTARDPTAAFYFVGARLWELALGGALALAPAAGPRRWAELAGAAGFLLIAASLAWLSPQQPFPGWRALVPTLGAALAIAAGPDAAVNRALAARPMVGLGLVSYPFYLWHWPLLTLLRLRDGGNPSLLLRWVLIALALALACATYVWLEKPIRFGAARARNAVAVLVALTALGAAGAVDAVRGGLLLPHASFQRVVHDGDIGADAYLAAVARATRPCAARFQPDGRGDFEAALCLQSRPEGAPEIALIGDSHGHQALLGLAEALPGRNVGYFGGAALHLFAEPANVAAMRALAKEASLQTAVFAARWSERRRRYADKAEFRRELRDAVAVFRGAGKRVFLLRDTPAFRFPPALCKYYEPLIYETRCDAPRADYDRNGAESDADLAAVAAEFPGVAILDPGPYFCDAESCAMARGDALMFRDENHLNVIGSRYLAGRLLADRPDIAGAGR